MGRSWLGGNLEVTIVGRRPLANTKNEIPGLGEKKLADTAKSTANRLIRIQAGR